MSLSITLAAKYEFTSYNELIDQVCEFVQREIQSPSLPQLPIFTFWMENGSNFVGIPLKMSGKDLNKYLTIISSDPIERPITTVFIPFGKIQSIQIAQSEAIMPILIKRELKSDKNLKNLSLASIRESFENEWHRIAQAHGLLPYVYFNWDEVGNSDFEKQNLVIISHSLLKAINTVVKNDYKRNVFNKLKTLQISNAPIKDVQTELVGAFLYVRANFLRAPSVGIEKELVMMLNDTLI